MLCFIKKIIRHYITETVVMKEHFFSSSNNYSFKIKRIKQHTVTQFDNKYAVLKNQFIMITELGTILFWLVT